jgi:hypothetical protein
MSRSRGIALSAFALGAASVGLAVFLYSQHLERAGAWAGIIGLPLAVIGVILGALPLLRDHRHAEPYTPSASRFDAHKQRHEKMPGAIQHNVATGGILFAVQGGDQYVNEPTQEPTAPPAPPSLDKPAENDA